MALSAARSEPQAIAVPAAEPRRTAAAGMPAALLRMQRAAGNAAVARAVFPRSIQRCGAGCGCTSCGHAAEDELLEEQRGADVLRAAVAQRSV